MIARSTYLCPACKHPLLLRREKKGVYLLWCASGRCNSREANRGAVGVAPQDAFNTLKEMVLETLQP